MSKYLKVLDLIEIFERNCSELDYIKKNYRLNLKLKLMIKKEFHF